MKKYCLCLLLFWIGLLSACATEQTISGEVLELHTDTARQITSLVVQTEEEPVAVVLTEEALRSFDPAKELEQAARIRISAICEPASPSAKNRGTLPAYSARRVTVTEVLQKEPVLLSDGTPVEHWKSSHYSVYRLADGTELLRASAVSGPENVYVGGIESFDDLAPAAQAGVSAFYQKQGLLYSLPDQLENACADFRSCADPAAFHSHFVGQDIAPTASSDQIMYFMTTVTCSIKGNEGYESYIGAAFDRNTGEVRAPWELFSCSRETAKQTLFSLSGVSDPKLLSEMRDAFQPEFLLFFPDRMEIAFPRGTLPSQEFPYLLSLSYDGTLREILQPWAIPKDEQSST